MAGYLDHARIGPLSRPAAAALADATGLAARVDPADLDRLFALSDAALTSAARLLDARPHEIALAPSTSNGLFTVAAALRGPGTVLVPRDEFPANLYPWLRFMRPRRPPSDSSTRPGSGTSPPTSCVAISPPTSPPSPSAPSTRSPATWRRSPPSRRSSGPDGC